MRRNHGGEPFLQPKGLLALTRALKRRDQHVTLYTGYTLKDLISRDDRTISRILELADILIDGPFVKELSDGAGEWRGSRRSCAKPRASIHQTRLRIKKMSGRRRRQSRHFSSESIRKTKGRAAMNANSNQRASLKLAPAAQTSTTPAHQQPETESGRLVYLQQNPKRLCNRFRS